MLQLFQLFHPKAESMSKSNNDLFVEYLNLYEFPKVDMLSKNNNLDRACAEKGNMWWYRVDRTKKLSKEILTVDGALKAIMDCRRAK